MKLLEGKIALITGSARGIGRATALRFAENGATVILNSRSAERLEQLAATIRETHSVECVAHAYDVADPAGAKQCFADIFRRFKRLDVLVNNAGILRDALLGMIPEELIQSTLSVNTAGAIYHLQEAARLMGRNRSGSIINVSSIIGRTGNAGQTVYAASKAALIGLTYAAAKELAPKNIRVNAVAPGFIETDMVKQLAQSIVEERVRSVKMGRIGQPEEVADTILFLASNLSAYVTGQVIGVDGGMLI
jgi:3-oxoacyl-[acyl-carrier protein] reductase